MKKIVSISAGHNPDGKVACGAVGIIKESTENRKVVSAFINRAVKKKYFDVRNCTINDAVSQETHLARCAAEHNRIIETLNLQIHFNSGGGKGCEILINPKSKNKDEMEENANKILKQLKKLGFKNRGVKYRDKLHFLNHVDNSMIIEVCFVDTKSDVDIYNAQGYKAVAKAIYKGCRKIFGEM